MKLSQRLAIGFIRMKFRVLTAISKEKAARAAFRLFCTPQSRARKKIPRIFHQGEELSFLLEGKMIRGWRFQAPHHDPVRRVLILHGFESSAINFDRYIQPLRKKGYEVLLFDAPAHGRSEGNRITAPMYRQGIKEIVLRYGPVTSFLAHSFGGLALALALEEINHQENFRVALVAPATETVTAIDVFFDFLKLDPAIRPAFEKVIVQNGGVSSSWYSIRRAMKHIRAQVLWFHDEEDTVTPLRDALRIKDDAPGNVKFVITKGLGHRRIYRDNKVSKAIIDFL